MSEYVAYIDRCSDVECTSIDAQTYVAVHRIDVLEEHIEHCFDHYDSQVAPLSMLIQLERAPELIDIINQHGWFIAEMEEWNNNTFQAHLLLHPVAKH